MSLDMLEDVLFGVLKTERFHSYDFFETVKFIIEHRVEFILESIENHQLPNGVEELMAEIFDEVQFRRLLDKYEVQSLEAVGTLTKDIIATAAGMLRDIEDTLNSPTKDSKDLISRLSEKFYDLIPHKSRPLIDNEEMLKSKYDLINDLLKVLLAYELAKSAPKGQYKASELYGKLQAEIEELSIQDPMHSLITSYVKTSHHDTRQFRLEVAKIYKINRHGDVNGYKPFERFENRYLLWHGTKTSNVASIISSGFTKPPEDAPEVPKYNIFGKGVYFADILSKSAKYCLVEDDKGYGFVFLSEVALGRMKEMAVPKWFSEVPRGFSSVKAMGDIHPDIKKATTLSNGELLLGGELVDNWDEEEDDTGNKFHYNEYVIYDTAQIKERFLVKLQFSF